MTLFDYLHLHPWLALLHSLALVLIIMISMHAAIGVIGTWFGTAKRLRELEEMVEWLKKEDYDVQRMAASISTVMAVMNQHYKTEDLGGNGEKAQAS